MGRVQEDHRYLQQEILTPSKSAWVKGRSYYGNTQAMRIGNLIGVVTFGQDLESHGNFTRMGSWKRYPSFPHLPPCPPEMSCQQSLSACTTRNQGAGSLLDASGPYKRQRTEEGGVWIWEESIQFPGEIVIKKNEQKST